MTTFTDFLSRFHPGQPALLWALSSGLVLILCLVGRRQWQARHQVVAADEDELRQADAWLPPKARPDNRRHSLRRTGALVRIKVIDPKNPRRTSDGFVLDRSTTGLRIALPASLPINAKWICIWTRHFSSAESGDVVNDRIHRG